MLFFSNAIANHRLTFTRLSDCMEHLTLVATWTEDAWGYIRNKGVEARKEIIREFSDQLYVGFLETPGGRQPVAMFALRDHAFHEDLRAGSSRLPRTRELTYVYVDKNYRGLGFARQIVNESKRLTRESGASLILLDTLRPDLTVMYEKEDAVAVCEGRLFTEPTELMYMRV